MSALTNLGEMLGARGNVGPTGQPWITTGLPVQYDIKGNGGKSSAVGLLMARLDTLLATCDPDLTYKNQPKVVMTAATLMNELTDVWFNPANNTWTSYFTDFGAYIAPWVTDADFQGTNGNGYVGHGYGYNDSQNWGFGTVHEWAGGKCKGVYLPSLVHYNCGVNNRIGFSAGGQTKVILPEVTFVGDMNIGGWNDTIAHFKMPKVISAYSGINAVQAPELQEFHAPLLQTAYYLTSEQNGSLHTVDWTGFKKIDNYGSFNFVQSPLVAELRLPSLAGAPYEDTVFSVASNGWSAAQLNAFLKMLIQTDTFSSSWNGYHLDDGGDNASPTETTFNIAGISTGNPCTVTTTAAHGMVAKDAVRIASVTGGTFSTAINALWRVVSVPSLTTFTVASNCTVAPTPGTGTAKAGGKTNRDWITGDSVNNGGLRLWDGAWMDGWPGW